LEDVEMKRNVITRFEDRTILITGHTGFIGSWLAIMLNELGANVIGYALAPYTSEDNYVLTHLEGKVASIIGDIRNYDNLKKTFQKYKPEIVYHLAAQPIVRKSYQIPKETFDINVGGTINIFEAFRKSDRAKLMVNFTSDKCYQNKEQECGYEENDRLGGADPYSSSKACSELITEAYRASFFKHDAIQDGKKISSIRCGNIIGGGDWQEDRLIPDCMRAIKNGKKIEIRNPNSVRPWQYILEPLRGLLMLTEKMEENNENNIYSSAWNFGPDANNIYSVSDLVIKVIDCMGTGSFKARSNQVSDLHETKLLLLDNSKSKRLLGWYPAISIDDAINFVCDWYREADINYDFDANQIKKYYNML
jgi:CDP-glucose 4,6-dehydratase